MVIHARIYHLIAYDGEEQRYSAGGKHSSAECHPLADRNRVVCHSGGAQLCLRWRHVTYDMGNVATRIGQEDVRRSGRQRVFRGTSMPGCAPLQLHTLTAGITNLKCDCVVHCGSSLVNDIHAYFRVDPRDSKRGPLDTSHMYILSDTC